MTSLADASDMNSRMSYVESELEFYFQNGFRVAVQDGGFSEEDVVQWSSIAKLFNLLKRETRESDQVQCEKLLMLLEDLYVSTKVDAQMGEDISSFDVEEVGAGYDIDLAEYRNDLLIAKSLISKEGHDLWHVERL